MPPLQQQNVFAWLSSLRLDVLDLPAAAAAFEAIGIEEVSDIADVDEEVLAVLKIELRRSGVAGSQLEIIVGALSASGPGPLKGSSMPAMCDESSVLGSRVDEALGRDLPCKSPMAAYFDGLDFYLPECPQSATCSALRSPVTPPQQPKGAPCSVASSPLSPPCPVGPAACHLHPAPLVYPVLLGSAMVLYQSQVIGTIHMERAGIAPSPVAGCVWALSGEPSGSRKVQRALEEARGEQERLFIALELRGHICDAMRCPHANHVLQKCAAILEPPSLQFMIDELVNEGPDTVCQVSKHCYGCRVMERLLARCASKQLFRIAGSLLGDAANLCTHRFGNFVMQRLLEHRSWRAAAVRFLEVNISEICRNFFGSMVLGHALRQDPCEGQARLVQALASHPKCLAELKRFKHGPAIVERVGHSVGDPQSVVGETPVVLPMWGCSERSD